MSDYSGGDEVAAQEDVTSDDLRQHSEDASEGADQADAPDQPREHSEQAAEGE